MTKFNPGDIDCSVLLNINCDDPDKAQDILVNFFIDQKFCCICKIRISAVPCLSRINGSCNFAARHLVTAQYEAKKRNFLGLVSEQDKYNLVNRLPELEVLPAAKELGIAFLPWSPLHGGYLSGTMMNRHAGSRGAEEFAAHLSEAQKQQLLQYESLCTDIGESQADVALAWLLRNPGVTAPIIGPRTDRQLESALHAAEIKLSDDVLKELDRIFPGPGGEAPEAYAW